MVPSSSAISPFFTLEGGVASSAAGSSGPHPVHFTERAYIPIRQDSNYCREYLSDMYNLFSQKILGKGKGNIYQCVDYAGFDRRFFLELESRRVAPISIGGFGRGVVSDSQQAFNQLLFDVVKDTIRDANTCSAIDFDPEKPGALLGLARDQRKRRLSISLANFMSRIEGVVLSVYSSKFQEQKRVTAGFSSGQRKKSLQTDGPIIDLEAENRDREVNKIADQLARADFRKRVAEPDLDHEFYQDLLAPSPEGDWPIFVDFQNLTDYCSQLEGLPIGSESVFSLAAEILHIRNRIAASLGSLGLDPHMEMLGMLECDDLIENAVKKHRVPRESSGLESVEISSCLLSATAGQSSSVAEPQGDGASSSS